jgi:hypothetical protein
MPAVRHVAVLGPIPRDCITTHRGEVFAKYGCAPYTVAALSALLDDDDRITGPGLPDGRVGAGDRA